MVWATDAIQAAESSTMEVLKESSSKKIREEARGSQALAIESPEEALAYRTQIRNQVRRRTVHIDENQVRLARLGVERREIRNYGWLESQETPLERGRGVLDTSFGELAEVKAQVFHNVVETVSCWGRLWKSTTSLRCSESLSAMKDACTECAGHIGSIANNVFFV